MLRIEEERKLMIPLETAVDAVLELDYVHAGQVSRGRLVGASIVGLGEGEPVLMITVESAGHDKSVPLQQHRYSLSTVAAAFLNYCFGCRIPLPRRAAKRIEATRDGFILTMYTSANVVRRHSALPAGPVVQIPARPRPAGEPAEQPPGHAIGERQAPQREHADAVAV